MANYYSIEMRSSGADETWMRLLIDQHFYNILEAERAAESQLSGGPEYRRIRVVKNGTPIKWNDGSGWRESP